MADIFISYEREDVKRYRRLEKIFKDKGWSVFDTGLSHGKDWVRPDSLRSALKEARCVVVLWSLNSVNSKWVIEESKIALKHEKLLNVAFDDVKTPFHISKMHIIFLDDADLYSESTALVGLLNGIEKFLKEHLSNDKKLIAPKKKAKKKAKKKSSKKKTSNKKTAKKKTTLRKEADAASIEDNDEEYTVFVPRAAQPEAQSVEDEIATKLDLAKAYIELGDEDSAKTMLDEVITAGAGDVLEQAKKLKRGLKTNKAGRSQKKEDKEKGEVESSSEEINVEDELDTKLDLAEAYIALDDKDSANTVLDEVISIGVGDVLERAKILKEKIITEQKEIEKANDSDKEFTFDLPDLIAARYEADSPDADDLIGVEEEARTFARYVTKKNLTTPLAIGLFGDWGSGKSFFMGKMQKFVGELEEYGRLDLKKDLDGGWCADVVQIEFNAWHYIESNLWASMVDHILNRLDDWLQSEGKRDAIDKLYEQFETAKEIEDEAKAELVAAESAKEDAKDKRNEAEGEYIAAVNKHRSLSTDDIWNAVTISFFRQVKSNPELKETINNASKTLGINELNSSAKALHEVIGEANNVVDRSRILFSSLISCQEKGRYILLVLLLAAAPLLVGVLWSHLADISPGFMQRIGSGVAELSAFLSVLAGWGAFNISSANNALNSLNRTHQDLQNIINDKTTEHNKQLADAESAVAMSEKRVSLAEERLSKAVQASDKARQMLEDETPRVRLTNFLRRRMDNADYTQHLGIVSMIRKDFDFLSRIMTSEELTKIDQEKLKQAGVNHEQMRTFERIILYIDDLDRCPAERVVEVLQAVHLFLAFPLFVVVVGVDARWVSRALSLKYQHLLSETVAHDLEYAPTQNKGYLAIENNTDNNERESLRISELIASSHDYLEKIFQIPYWVKPMDEMTSKEFMEGLARSSTQFEDGVEKEAENENISIKSNDKDITTQNVSEHEMVTSASKDIQKDESVSIKTQSQQQVDTEQNVQEEENDEIAGTPALLLTEMPLHEDEIEFMKMLAPYVGRSPRRTKQFFNVYQLVRAGLTVDERMNFFGKNNESLEYRVLLCLLAIITGSPIMAPRFFSSVVDWADENKKSLRVLISKLEKDEVFTTSTEWPKLLGTLNILRDLKDDTKTFQLVRYWSRRAMRFSFTARPI